MRAVIRFLLLVAIASLGQSAKIANIWKQYVKDRIAGKTNTLLPDFSYAGYHHGDKKIPTISGPIFDVTKLGCRANQYCDDAIIDAIERAEARGGGVIYFPPGKYYIGQNRGKMMDSESFFKIKGNNIVFRGAGVGKTTLYAVTPLDEQYKFYFFFKGTGRRGAKTTLKSAYKPGSMQMKWSSTKEFKAGDCVMITMDQDREVLKSWLPKDFTVPAQWATTAKGMGFNIPMCIKKVIDSTTVQLTAPLPFELRSISKSIVISKWVPVQECGVEGIHFVSAWESYRGDFKHHSSARDDYGWQAIYFREARNCWVRNSKFESWNYFMRAKNSMNLEYRNNQAAGKYSHGGTQSASGSYNLFIDSEETNFHGPSVMSNDQLTVYVRTKMQQGQSTDWHARSPHHTLLDQTVGGTFQKSGGDTKYWPMHIKSFVAWNFYYNRGPSDANSVTFWHRNWYSTKQCPLYYNTMYVGVHGNPPYISSDGVAYTESWGEKVYPLSLYDAQLAFRRTGYKVDPVRSDGTLKTTTSSSGSKTVAEAAPAMMTEYPEEMQSEDAHCVCVWSEWIGSCDGTPGFETRQPKCSASCTKEQTPHAQSRPCPECACSTWSAWAQCDCAADAPSQSRARTCGVSKMLRARASKLCLVDERGKVVSGACDSPDVLQFYWDQTSTAQQLHTGPVTCLDAGRVGSAGAPTLVNRACTGAASQKWVVSEGQVKNAQSGLCLELCAGACEPDTVVLRPCGSLKAQLFDARALPSVTPVKCNVAPHPRCEVGSQTQCGSDTISKAACTLRGCCWDPSKKHKCTQPGSEAKSAVTLKKGTHDIRKCSKNTCRASGGGVIQAASLSGFATDNGLADIASHSAGDWSAWSAWSHCAGQCGSGTRTRTRTCKAGSSCPGLDRDTENCENKPCPVDGHWSSWSAWSSCSQTCGGGVRQAHRTCSRPAPEHGGLPCKGKSARKQVCNERPCAVPAREAASVAAIENVGVTVSSATTSERECATWSSWTQCSEPCGTGIQTRARPASENCPGEESRACHQQPCPMAMMCQSDYSERNECGTDIADQKTCEAVKCCYQETGDGPDCFLPFSDTTHGANLVANPGFERIATDANTGHVTFSDWRSLDAQLSEIAHTGMYAARLPANTETYVAQTVTLDQSVATCFNVSANALSVSLTRETQTARLVVRMTYADSTHEIKELEFKEHNGVWLRASGTIRPAKAVTMVDIAVHANTDNPVDLVVDDIALVAPKDLEGECTWDGADVPGIGDATAKVDGGWSEWNPWTSCTGPCGTNEASQSRTRSCTSPAPQFGGEPCPTTDDSVQTRPCTVSESCDGAVDGVWSEWGPWSTCNGQCGTDNGKQQRSRMCSEPEKGGKPCEGEPIESRICTAYACTWCVCTDWVRSGNCACDTGLQPYSRQCSAEAPTALMESAGQTRCITLKSKNEDELGLGSCSKAVNIWHDNAFRSLRVDHRCLAAKPSEQSDEYLVTLAACDSGDDYQLWSPTSTDGYYLSTNDGPLCMSTCDDPDCEAPLVMRECDEGAESQWWTLIPKGDSDENACAGWPLNKTEVCGGTCQSKPPAVTKSEKVTVLVASDRGFDEGTFLTKLEGALKIEYGSLVVVKVLEGNVYHITLELRPEARKAMDEALKKPYETFSPLHILEIRRQGDLCGVQIMCSRAAPCDSAGQHCELCYESWIAKDGVCVDPKSIDTEGNGNNNNNSTTDGENGGSGEGSEGLSTGAIVGISASASVALVALVAASSVGLYKFRQRRKQEHERSEWWARKHPSALVIVDKEDAFNVNSSTAIAKI